MPNNLQILAYVQAMEDSVKSTIDHCLAIGSNGGKTPGLLTHEMYLKDLENLEKFIKGGK